MDTGDKSTAKSETETISFSHLAECIENTASVSHNQHAWLPSAALKIHVNQFSHLVVKGEEKRVVLSFVGLCIGDDLPNIPVNTLKRRKSSEYSFCSIISHCKKTKFIHFSYESVSSLANECSLRNILHGPHSPAHLLCPEELQPGSETKRPLSHPGVDRTTGTLRQKTLQWWYSQQIQEWKTT